MSEATLLLEACEVAKRFDSVVALKAASLRVRPGEVHGLMGANGAGKSTLVKIITGVFPADGGQIAVKVVVRSFRSPAEARRAGIVSVYQDPALVPDLTIAQNMRLAGASVGRDPVGLALVDRPVIDAEHRRRCQVGLGDAADQAQQGVGADRERTRVRHVYGSLRRDDDVVALLALPGRRHLPGRLHSLQLAR